MAMHDTLDIPLRDLLCIASNQGVVNRGHVVDQSLCPYRSRCARFVNSRGSGPWSYELGWFAGTQSAFRVTYMGFDIHATRCTRA
jgi:hypothetical protein